MKLKWKWKHVGGSVYESFNGFRIHVGGLLVRTPAGIIDSGFDWSNATEMYSFTRLMGGNRKRALMAFAETFYVATEIIAAPQGR